jgi:hypothetical protein
MIDRESKEPEGPVRLKQEEGQWGLADRKEGKARGN